MSESNAESSAVVDRRCSVLWVSKTLAPGGVENLLALLADRFDRSRFDVTCVFVTRSESDVSDRLRVAGVECGYVGGPLWPVRLFGLVASSHVDVVHAHSPAPAAITRIANRIRFRHRAVHVTTEHNPRQHYRLLSRVATSLTSALDDVVIAASVEVARSIRGRASARCRTQYQGIDVGRFRRSATSRSDRGPSDGLRILCVANFRPQKAHEVLLGALEILHRWRVPFRLTLLGGSSSTVEVAHERRIRSLVDESVFESCVEFASSTTDVAMSMADHDVLVISSSYEAGPLVAMEAAASRLPIVATDVGIIHELFVDGESCLRVPVGDSDALASALRRVSEDSELARRLADGGAMLAEGFDVDRVAADLFDLYRIEAGRRRPARSMPRRPR